MKECILFLAFLFVLISPAFAGSANCTGSTAVSTPQTYFASPECVISAEIPVESMGYLRVWLPSDPSFGDEFTVQENGGFLHDSGEWYDEENQVWVPYAYDYTGGMSLYTSDYLINDPELGTVYEAANFTPGRYLKVIFDGEYWQLEQGSL